MLLNGSLNSVVPHDYTLLIVDDEVEIREILAYQFRKDGFKVFEANSGEEAFQIAKKEKIDLIISDVRMPGGTGLELLEKIKAQNCEVPIVLFITGFTDLTLEDAFDKGAEAVFSKPFDRKILLNTVLQALTPKEIRWHRKEWRGETILPIEISSPDFKAGVEGRIMNLGRGGIFISLDQAMPNVGDSISFKIKFNEGTLLSIEGRGLVKWHRNATGSLPRGCGVEFIDLTNDTKNEVIKFINFLKTKQFIPKC